MDSNSLEQTQPTDIQTFAAIRAYEQVNGRIVNYVKCGEDNPITIAKYTRTMRGKYGLGREDIERMLAEMYPDTVQRFLELPLGSPWYQPARLTRFNEMKSLLLA